MLSAVKMTRFIYHLLEWYYKEVKLNFGVKVLSPFPSPKHPQAPSPQLPLYLPSQSAIFARSILKTFHNQRVKMEDFEKGVEGIIRL
jgi:hypothetical protein